MHIHETSTRKQTLKRGVTRNVICRMCIWLFFLLFTHFAHLLVFSCILMYYYSRKLFFYDFNSILPYAINLIRPKSNRIVENKKQKPHFALNLRNIQSSIINSKMSLAGSNILYYNLKKLGIMWYGISYRIHYHLCWISICSLFSNTKRVIFSQMKERLHLHGVFLIWIQRSEYNRSNK